VNLNLSKSAHDFLQGLQAKQYKQVASQILRLQANPRPQYSKHVTGYPGYFRIDCGEFRVCFFIKNDVVCVSVVGKRNDDEVYRELRRKA
jgi:mRNA interferase RelE/StbE